jgi:hypothetical protein
MSLKTVISARVRPAYDFDNLRTETLGWDISALLKHLAITDTCAAVNRRRESARRRRCQRAGHLVLYAKVKT